MTTVDSQRHRENEKICRTSASRRDTADLRSRAEEAERTLRSRGRAKMICKRLWAVRRFSLASLPISLMEQGEALNRTHTRMTSMTRCFRVPVVNN